MEQSFDINSPFFVRLFRDALVYFLTSQKIKEEEYRLFSNLNEQQRFLIGVEYINVR